MKEFNITNTGVKIDVAAIEWPANATALVYHEDLHDEEEDEEDDQEEDDALVCRTTDPDESKEGAETSEIRIRCDSKLSLQGLMRVLQAFRNRGGNGVLSAF